MREPIKNQKKRMYDEKLSHFSRRKFLSTTVSGALFYIGSPFVGEIRRVEDTKHVVQNERMLNLPKEALITELEPVFYTWAACPGEYLSVLDNFSDFEACKKLVGANASETNAGASFEVNDDPIEPDFKSTRALNDTLLERKSYCSIGIGEYNNPYFPIFSAEFMKKYPQVMMQDAEGKPILLYDKLIRSGTENPMPAVDDPTVLHLYSRIISGSVEILRENPYVTSWVIGDEEMYSDYCELPMGDFRPYSWKHFLEWLNYNGWNVPLRRDLILANVPNSTRSAWFHFRYQAMADRAAYYMQAFLGADGQRPVFYPTHGTPFCLKKQVELGQPAVLMAGVCDGLEMGHITIDDDDERLNPLILAYFAASGIPLIVPRLGNRTLDATARGFGRSFTPAMLRRLVYECLGMGVWHIGPIHWRSILHDGEWFIKGTPAEKECGLVFREIHEARPILDGMSHLQPQVGLYVSDDTWLDSWNPRWTGFFQDSLDAHWNMTIIGDSHLSADFARSVPVIISIDNPRVSENAFQRLIEFVKAGGQLVVWGPMAEFDEKVKIRESGAIKELMSMQGVIRVQEYAGTMLRWLINETLCHWVGWGGSIKVRQNYTPAPFKGIDAAIRKAAPQCILNPCEIFDTPDASKINIFTLTDRTSLLFVAINNTDQSVSFTMKPNPGLLSHEKRWAFYDVTKKQEHEGLDSYPLTLGANASAMIWLHPSVEPAKAKQDISMALNTIKLWNNKGCNTEFLKRHYHALQIPGDNPGSVNKKYCLARAILTSLCLKASIKQQSDGSLHIEAIPYDNKMKISQNTVITARIVPDKFRRHYLKESNPGSYNLLISENKMPVLYNADSQRYSRITGPIRLYLNAMTDKGITGGCMINYKVIP